MEHRAARDAELERSVPTSAAEALAETVRDAVERTCAPRRARISPASTKRRGRRVSVRRRPRRARVRVARVRVTGNRVDDAFDRGRLSFRVPRDCKRPYPRRSRRSSSRVSPALERRAGDGAVPAARRRRRGGRRARHRDRGSQKHSRGGLAWRAEKRTDTDAQSGENGDSETAAAALADGRLQLPANTRAWRSASLLSPKTRSDPPGKVAAATQSRWFDDDTNFLHRDDATSRSPPSPRETVKGMYLAAAQRRRRPRSCARRKPPPRHSAPPPRPPPPGRWSWRRSSARARGGGGLRRRSAEAARVIAEGERTRARAPRRKRIGRRRVAVSGRRHARASISARISAEAEEAAFAVRGANVAFRTDIGFV